MELALYDLQGRYIGSKTYSTVEGHNSFEYDISDMAAGIYLVNIHGNKGSATAKVVKY